jgi:hypothetical protein
VSAEGVDARGYILRADEVGVMIEVECPLCGELHTHIVAQDWAGEVLIAPCKLGSYRVRL